VLQQHLTQAALLGKRDAANFSLRERSEVDPAGDFLPLATPPLPSFAWYTCHDKVFGLGGEASE
jgi:hypothetical protein